MQTCTLTHYSPVILFYTPWKHQKTLFSGGIDKQHRAVMSQSAILCALKVFVENIYKFPRYIPSKQPLIADKIF